MPTTYPHPIDALVERLAQHADLPGLGTSVHRVTELADNATTTLGQLANTILADVSLTQKVLRLANTVLFRPASQPVTTVSKAIARIGSEQVRIIALSATLLERIDDRRRAAALRPELVKSLYASMLAQRLGPRIGLDSEEAAIAAMFRGIGRLLVGTYEPEAFDEILRTARDQGITEPQAVHAITGGTFEFVGQRILQMWGIPDDFVRATTPRNPGGATPAGKIERLQLVSQFSVDVAASLRSGVDPGQRAHALGAAFSGFGEALKLDRAAFQQALDETSERARHFARALDPEVVVPPDDEGEPAARPAAPAAAHPAYDADALIRDSALQPPPEPSIAEGAPDGGAPGAKPANTSALLLAGIQDMITALGEGSDAASVLSMAAETLHRSLGYRRTLLCLRDVRVDLFRPRVWFGEISPAQLRQFACPAAQGGDLFRSVIARNVDVHIQDVAAGHIHEKLPDWYRAACPDARSFVLLPIVVQHRPFGFFYADRPEPDQVGLAQDELQLVRMLKGQTLIALRGHR